MYPNNSFLEWAQRLNSIVETKIRNFHGLRYGIVLECNAFGENMAKHNGKKGGLHELACEPFMFKYMH